MSDLKSKLPDLKELGQMAGKLFKDIKTSLDEIVTSYKEKRPAEATQSEPPKKEESAKKAKETAEVKEEKKVKDEKKVDEGKEG